MSQNPSTEVEHLGHTSFAIRRGNTRILIDPIIVRKDLNFRDASYARWYYEDRTGFDAIFISHGHNDHLHPPSLLGFPRDTSFFFMDEDPATCSCEPDEDPYHLLPNLGFSNYKGVDPGESVEMGDDIKVHFLPAQPSSEGEEQCCFLVETPDLILLDAVDIKDDPITRAALEPYRGRVDLAFLPTGEAVQWQGFWNQMDAVQAVGFSRWLKPTRVATCGGTISLHGRPLPHTLERYPHHTADWLRTGLDRLDAESLFTGQAPCRITYRDHELLGVSPVRPMERYEASSGATGPQPVVAAFFTGYHPQVPSRRLIWPDDSMAQWLGALGEIRDIIRHSEGDLRNLLDRTQWAINHTPAKLLAPATLRRLLDAGELDVAAKLTAFIPPVPKEFEELSGSYFGIVEAIVSTADIAQDLRDDLFACVWIDRRMYQIFNLYLQLRGLVSFPAEDAKRLRQQHLVELHGDFAERRPVLGIHHIRLDRHQAELLNGEKLAEEHVELMCYPGTQGVYQRPLKAIEQVILNACDGRRAKDIAADLASALGVPEEEISEAMFRILAGLSVQSVLAVDWST